MSTKNKKVFKNDKLKLPEEYQLRLNGAVTFAQQIFQENLKSIILGGSGGKSNIIPCWSDLDMYIVLENYSFVQVKKFMVIDNENDDKIHIGVTIYTLNEVRENLIDGKTKIMAYEKEIFGFNPTLFGKNYFRKQNYMDIQRNDLDNLPNIMHTCRRNCISIQNNEIKLSKNHIKKFIVLLKCILNINGIFSYGYLKVMNDFYNLCETKQILDKSLLNFNMKEILKPNYKIEDATKEFIEINKFLFKNIIELINISTNETEKNISCMGIVTYEKDNMNYVALLKDVNNCWVLPKGHSEKEETFIEAAIREIYEETNIVVNNDNLVDKVGEYGYFSDIENKEKLIKIYLFKINESQIIKPLAEENFVDGKWFLLEDAIGIVTYHEQKMALEKVVTMLN